MDQDTSKTMAHHEVAADALASDAAGLELLRAAAAAAHAAAAIIPTADQPRGNIALAAEWTQNYFDQPIDLTAYDAMADDTTRTPLFAAAIQRRLKGQVGWTVLDIGTGPHCLLALIAARAGARRVYAIEANEAAAERARQSVKLARDVPDGIVTVITGFSTSVTLPEKVDLVVAELVGSVATSEGLISTMRDAQQRHLKRPFEPSSYIPQRVQTAAAPASYVLASLLRPPYSHRDVAAERAAAGGLPVLVGCADAALHRLSPPQILEDVDLTAPMPPLGRTLGARLRFRVDEAFVAAAEETHRTALGASLLQMSELGCDDQGVSRLARSIGASLAGLACWPRLLLDGSCGLIIEGDACSDDGDESHWQTALPLLTARPVPVAAADEIDLAFEAMLGERVDEPVQYRLRGELRPADK